MQSRRCREALDTKHQVQGDLGLREVIPQKKLLPFGHCPKVALTPPPLVLDTFEVTFV